MPGLGGCWHQTALRSNPDSYFLSMRLWAHFITSSSPCSLCHPDSPAREDMLLQCLGLLTARDPQLLTLHGSLSCRATLLSSPFPANPQLKTDQSAARRSGHPAHLDHLHIRAGRLRGGLRLRLACSAAHFCPLRSPILLQGLSPRTFPEK